MSEDSSPTAPRPLFARLAVPALLFAAVFAAFWPALSAEFQEGWDDNYTITENGHFRGLSLEHLRWMFTTGRLGHWQPLSWVTFAVNYKLGELDPFGYHLVNLLIHALNAVLFFFLGRALLRLGSSAPGAGERVLPALAGALLFAVHPLRVESVAWVTERRDVLSTLFLLCTVLAWLRYASGGGAKWYAAAALAFALSLLSKAWGITLPAVLLVLDAWPLGRLRERSLLSLVVEKVPLGLLSIGAAVAAYWAQSSSGAMHYAEHFDVLQKAAQACYGLCFYVVKTVAPFDLLPAYLLEKDLKWSEPRFLASFAGVAAALVAIVVLRRRLPALTTACVVYAIVVSPVLGLTQSGVQLVADRYTYLATMPFALLLAGAVARAAAGTARTAAMLATAVVAVVLGGLTHAYTRYWHDSETLWEYTLEIEPDHSLAYNQLGTQYMKEGDNRRALECYENAVRVNPSSHLAYENRGIMRMRAGDNQGALDDWERAIELNEHCAIPIVNRGSLRFQAGDYAGALADYELALSQEEDQAGVWYMLGSARFKLGNYPGAREAVQRCLEMAAADTPLHDQALKFLADIPSAP
ncbi:MAG: tetratricopeptide repeat protein [Planctomycetota bacterium]